MQAAHMVETNVLNNFGANISNDSRRVLLTKTENGAATGRGEPVGCAEGSDATAKGSGGQKGKGVSKGNGGKSGGNDEGNRGVGTVKGNGKNGGKTRRILDGWFGNSFKQNETHMSLQTVFYVVFN